MVSAISAERCKENLSKPLGGALCELFKARLCALVMLTVLAGYYLGAQQFEPVRLANSLFGSAMLIVGAASLNQFLEIQKDSAMGRTRHRPLITGRFAPEKVLVIGGMCSGAGMVWLTVTVGTLPAILGVFGALNYLIVYTLLKHVTALNIVPGAISGAVPPLMGWAAARGELSPAAWSIAAILFFWQLPHFLAIAWMHRDDYTRSRFSAVAFDDPAGLLFSRYAVSNAVCLLLVSTTPFFLGLTGPAYLGFAIVLGLALIGCAIGFARARTTQSARRLFKATIVYLPLLLAWLALTKKSVSGGEM